MTRVTNNMLANNFLRDVFYNNQRTMRVQEQISTGRLVNNPSEDPIISDQVIGLNLQISRAAQYLRNGATGSSYLQLTDSSLGDVNTMVQSARTLAVQMANGTVNATMRAGGAQEIQQILEQAVEVANRRFRGRFIFGGLQTTQPPFEVTADGVLYKGDLGHINLRMSDSSANQINVNGADAFGAFSARMPPAGAVNLDPVLNLAADGTRLGDLNSGAGVSAGGIRLTYSGGLADVDLSAAESLADVADMISAATGGLVALGTDATGHALTLTDGGGGPITVAELNGNTTAKDLGLLGAGGATLTGLALQVQVTALTKLADLRNGAGNPIDAASGFIITNSLAGTPVAINMPAGGTVQDLLTELNNSAANVYAEISTAGRQIDIYSRLNGPTMTISDIGPGTTAADLGVATAGVRADNLFTTLIDLRDALQNNDRDAVAATINDLDRSMTQLLSARAQVGARVQRFETTNNRQSDEKYNLTELLSEANDTDYARAVMEFQQLQNVLEASLRMASQTLPLSLANFI